jgi:hypothetical protein
MVNVVITECHQLQRIFNPAGRKVTAFSLSTATYFSNHWFSKDMRVFLALGDVERYNFAFFLHPKMFFDRYRNLPGGKYATKARGQQMH